MSAYIADVLRGARDLLTDEERWIKHGPLAVDAANDPTEPVGEDEEGNALSPDAVAWCLVGALQRAAGYKLRFDDPLLEPLRRAIPGPRMALGIWNDAAERTHDDVLAALDRAIEATT